MNIAAADRVRSAATISEGGGRMPRAPQRMRRDFADQAFSRSSGLQRRKIQAVMVVALACSVP